MVIQRLVMWFWKVNTNMHELYKNGDGNYKLKLQGINDLIFSSQYLPRLSLSPPSLQQRQTPSLRHLLCLSTHYLAKQTIHVSQHLCLHFTFHRL